MAFFSRRADQTRNTNAAGVYITAGELARLEHGARGLSFLPRRPNHSLLSGRHDSRIRGRGLEFEELRHYLPGDDIRAMDWRVTARALTPFVRVFTTEKDRPALIVVDQRLNMFFGSRRAMKSVTAAEAAALTAWCMLDAGDRVGGYILTDAALEALPPQRGRGAVLRLLGRLSEANQALRVDSAAPSAPQRLNQALDAASRLADHDHLIVIISDFDGADNTTRDLLLRLAVRNDVVATLIADSFFVNPPAAGELVAGDGVQQVELRFAQEGQRRGIAEFVAEREARIRNFQSEVGIPVIALSTDNDTAAQLRRHLVLRNARRRGRVPA